MSTSSTPAWPQAVGCKRAPTCLLSIDGYVGVDGRREDVDEDCVDEGILRATKDQQATPPIHNEPRTLALWRWARPSFLPFCPSLSTFCFPTHHSLSIHLCHSTLFVPLSPWPHPPSSTPTRGHMTATLLTRWVPAPTPISSAAPPQSAYTFLARSLRSRPRLVPHQQCGIHSPSTRLALPRPGRCPERARAQPHRRDLAAQHPPPAPERHPRVWARARAWYVHQTFPADNQADPLIPNKPMLGTAIELAPADGASEGATTTAAAERADPALPSNDRDAHLPSASSCDASAAVDARPPPRVPCTFAIAHPERPCPASAIESLVHLQDTGIPADVSPPPRAR